MHCSLVFTALALAQSSNHCHARADWEVLGGLKFKYDGHLRTIKADATFLGGCNEYVFEVADGRLVFNPDLKTEFVAKNAQNENVRIGDVNCESGGSDSVIECKVTGIEEEGALHLTGYIPVQFNPEMIQEGDEVCVDSKMDQVDCE